MAPPCWIEVRYIDKIKEKPQVQHTLKERVKSAPKKLIRRGLDDGTERLAERLLGRRKKGAAHNPDTGPNGHSGRHDPQGAAQSQEMTVFCLQGTVFMGEKREIRSRRRVQSEATPRRSPHSKSLKKEALRPRTPI